MISMNPGVSTKSGQHLHPGLQAGLFTLLMVLTIGCSQSGEEDEHHLEHVIPAHKPQSFREAVVQLKSRGTKYFHDDMTDAEARELHDIINWLPEVAANSDLRKTPWEQVQTISVQLNVLFERRGNAAAGDEWQQNVSQLEQLVPLAEVSELNRLPAASTDSR